METKCLRNYGKSLLEMMGNLPHEVTQEVAESSSRMMKKHLSSENLEQFASILPVETAMMKKHDVSGIAEKGLSGEAFISQQIEWAASFSSISKIIGREKALTLFRETTESTYPKLFFALFPEPETLRRTEDQFNAFREWFSALMKANKEAGLFDYEVVENKHSALQVNCTWCAWYEIHKALGAKDACIPVCHSDDAFYPAYLRETDIIYKRTKTLGWGNECCDFRFERRN